MFTGLVEEQGKVSQYKTSSEGMELYVTCQAILSDIKLGASICVNGVCLSVSEFGNNYIKTQVSNETLKVSNFKYIKINDFLNLERALTLEKRLDGHILSGHIDCLGELTNIQSDGFSKKLFFRIPKDFEKYIIYKGSIGINGVSLTIASIKDNIFSVELIPITLREVNLSKLKIGDIVNIETDLFAKYVEKIYNSNNNKSNIDYGFLAENGYV